MFDQEIPLKEKRSQRIGLALYMLGLLLGLTLALAAIWGDLEAFLFDIMFRPEQNLSTLSCPILITADEETAVSATFTNNRDQDENVLVRAHISQGRAILISEQETRITIPPGEDATLTWPISAEDAAWNRIVLVRIGAVQRVPFPQLVGGACGVLLIPVSGITGNQIILFMIAASTILLAAGMWLWRTNQIKMELREKKYWRLMITFVGLMAAAIVVSFLKLWLLGIIIFIFILLLTGSAIEYIANV